MQTYMQHMMHIMNIITMKHLLSKYVFSQDHKMIAKQFLVTGIIWAIIGGLFSVLFRLQLGYPEQYFSMAGRYSWAIGQKAEKFILNFIMHWLPCTEPSWCSLY